MFGLIPFVTGAVAFLSAVFHGLDRPKDVFLAYIPALVAALLFGLPLTTRLGIIGACVGFISSLGIVGVVLLVKLPSLLDGLAPSEEPLS